MAKTATAKTIGNPLTWAARQLRAGGEHLADSTRHLGGDGTAAPEVLVLTAEDLAAALRAGWRDFLAFRSDVIFLVLIYPLAGLVLMGVALRLDLLALLFPLVSGFAILGPVAAVGLYELSRRREAGLPAGWSDAFAVIRAPGFAAILALGLYLIVLFLLWIAAAHAIHGATMGPATPDSAAGFLRAVLTTPEGGAMIMLGIGVGAGFALVALAVSVVSFPLLLDRAPGLPVAVVTSVRVFARNPGVILAWGAIVAGGLVLGALPMLLGLVVVLPVLGHATWHLYRRALA